MEASQLRDYKAIYVIGSVHAALHLIVGIIWETVSLPPGDSALLSLPYFGGELALVAICLLLVFLYLALGLRREPGVPVHIRKFCLTLSFVVAAGSLILLVVMSIRANDYRKEKDAMAREAYYGAVLMTVADILATIFVLPCYVYLAACNYRLVKDQEKQEEAQQQRQQGQEEGKQPADGHDRTPHNDYN